MDLTVGAAPWWNEILVLDSTLSVCLMIITSLCSSWTAADWCESHRGIGGLILSVIEFDLENYD